jgi:hypothetical protein
MGKSKSTKTKLPGWYEDAAKEQIAQAQRVAAMDFMPYMGQVTAAANPQLQNAWSQADQWGQAAGFGSAGPYQQTPTHAYPMYQQQMEMMRQNYPGLMAQREAIFQPPPPPEQMVMPTYEQLLQMWMSSTQPDGFGDAGNSVGGGDADAASAGDGTDAGTGFGGGSDGPY